MRKTPMIVDFPALFGPTSTLKSCSDMLKFANALYLLKCTDVIRVVDIQMKYLGKLCKSPLMISYINERCPLVYMARLL